MKLCDYCGTREVDGAYSNEDGSGFCGSVCTAAAMAELDDAEPFGARVVLGDEEYGDDQDSSYEESMVNDFSDDAEVLASAGWGTDEDYHGNDLDIEFVGYEFDE